jgi:GMP synthase (glutamine-hydrolysing)
MDKILILDFGSQTTQLIGRRIRDLGVYTEILPGDARLSGEVLYGDKSNTLKGIILSGSPESVYTKDGAVPDKCLYELELPLLGICYGLQRMTWDLGGKVEPLEKREYGRIGVTVTAEKADEADFSRTLKFLAGFDKTIPLSSITPGGTLPADLPLFKGIAFTAAFTAWMSHGDTLTELAPGFRQYGTSDTGYPAVVAHTHKPWFGLQFHPEATHTERGTEALAAFVFGVCGCIQGWSMEKYMEEICASLPERVGNAPVLLLISGGVDSTVAGALLLKALGNKRVHLMYIDTGLMRKNETKTVSANLKRLGAIEENLHIRSYEREFLKALKGLTDPEEKRKAIGDLFIKKQQGELKDINLPDSCFLAQGTLYTDLIESGKGVGKKARLIKTHHNVGSPLVDAKRRAGRIIEPLDRLYKDEVRALGRLLGIDEDIVRRHPFPGPGLAVRILGEVTREKCEILREADSIFIEELKKRRTPAGNSLYDEIWQAFAVLLPIRSVGVAGDVRKYGWVLALRAIASADGMTADVYPFPTQDLLEISTLITNTVKDIGRVTYDISSKPPATIEWE